MKKEIKTSFEEVFITTEKYGKITSRDLQLITGFEKYKASKEIDEQKLIDDFTNWLEWLNETDAVKVNVTEHKTK